MPEPLSRTVHPSIDALLAAEAGPGPLERMPLRHEDSLSGGTLEWVRSPAHPGRRLVLKRFSYATDWVMRASADDQGRAVQVWAAGVLDALPAGVVHGYRGCARDGEGWAVLLDDLSHTLIPPGDVPVTAAQEAALLEGFAALHAAFWQRPPAAGWLFTLQQRYAAITPEVSRREAGGADPIPPLIAQGWDLLFQHQSGAEIRLLQRLLADPGPLARALARYPHTLLHGDSKMGNLGVTPDGDQRAVLLDWAAVGTGPPAVELGWYLAVNSAKLSGSKETSIATYQAALARRLGPDARDGWWKPQLELALLGGFLQLGWAKALGALGSDDPAVRRREAAEVDWWLAHVAAAAPLLDRD